MHGGFELLKSRHVDRCLQKLVMDEFGIPLTVSFDGTLTIDHESSVYIERKKQQEEPIQREQVVEQVERYEESMQERPNPKTTQIRTSETLMPTVLPNTARDIYGRPVKGKTIAIGKVTPDAGNVTIWGEIFDLEERFTRDKSKKIYSIKITDYTGSMTLKIIDD